MTKLSIIFKALLLSMLVCIGSTISSAIQVAPELQTAVLSASIVDLDGQGIPNVSVLIADDKRTWSVQSDDSGNFKVALPVGTYSLKIKADGFRKTVVADVGIEPGPQINLKVTLEVGEMETLPRIVSETPVDVSHPINFSPRFRPVAAPQSAPNIGVTGNLSPSTVKRGRVAQGTITMDIPAGYHVNSNHPLEEFLVATKLTVEAPQGIRVGAIVYPRPLLRTFKFSKNKLSVYEGKVVLRFSATVPASVGAGSVELKAHLRYQSCNDSLCFPPKNKDVSLSLTIN